MTEPAGKKQPSAKEIRENFQVVFVGHVDHGKSTLLGRIYADTGSIPEGHVEKVRRICEQQGKLFEYAFLFDAFIEEQEQGITIDTARTFFNWKGREYIIIDAPGHKEFLKNMISGAARADAAILVIDAAEGIREQSRQHGYMLSLLGIRQVSVVVNKMDLSKYDESVFRKIEDQFSNYLRELDIHATYFIPASAREGDNVVERSGKMSWYDGPTVLETLERFEKLPPRENLPLRFPVQDIYKFDERRIIAGRVAAGTIRIGDRLVFSPSNKTAVVKSIESFNVPVPPTSATAGQSTGFTLDEQIFIERGEIASLTEDPPEVSALFRANVFWMGDSPLREGQRYEIRLATREMEMQVTSIHNIMDAETLGKAPATGEVPRYAVAEVTIQTKHPIAFDRYTDNQNTGRFVIVDGYEISGGGIITEPLEDDLTGFRREARLREFLWRKGEVRLNERIRRSGHNPGLILFTGERGTGKARLGRKLERRLFSSGKQVTLLDAKNIQLSLGRDLPEADKLEMVRRFSEVAQILLRSGMIVVSTTNTFALADHQPIRELVHPHRVVTVHMAFEKGDLPDKTDLSFLESGDMDEAAKRIVKEMEEKGILF
ncbi:MAG: GTP-binding protein [bacterium]|nr:GTP-binding protein [bacterium]